MRSTMKVASRRWVWACSYILNARKWIRRDSALQAVPSLPCPSPAFGDFETIRVRLDRSARGTACCLGGAGMAVASGGPSERTIVALRLQNRQMLRPPPAELGSCRACLPPAVSLNRHGRCMRPAAPSIARRDGRTEPGSFRSRAVNGRACAEVSSVRKAADQDERAAATARCWRATGNGCRGCRLA